MADVAGTQSLGSLHRIDPLEAKTGRSIMMDLKRDEDREMNRDPLSGAPGAHPIGTGIGAAGGVTAGAMVGSVGGPVGTTIGGMVGAIVGGLAGKELGEAVNPTTDDSPWDSYWRETYRKEPYYKLGRTFEDYASAYRLGYTFHSHDGERTWDDVHADWERTKGASHLEWEEAIFAVRAALHRARAAELVP